MKIKPKNHSALIQARKMLRILNNILVDTQSWIFLNLVSVRKQHFPSFRRMPESSNVLNSLDPGIRRNDVVSGKRVFLTKH